MPARSFLEAALEILRSEKRPMSAKEITSAAISKSLISSGGKTPIATMGARIYVDIKQNGDASLFQKLGRGKFGLREWGPTKTFGSQKDTFKNSAYEILKSASKPMSSEDITNLATARGLVKTSGKTPAATMGAQLYTDIKKFGDRSQFIQLGKNRFGLREWDLNILKEDIEKAEKEKALAAIDRTRAIVGDPINFRGQMYGPTNENGVIFLFGKIHQELGINVEAIQPFYPDAKGRRKARRGWEDVWIEFEYKSSSFKVHGHDPQQCDILVCWEHDWKDCPPTLQVIELKSVIQQLEKREQT